MTNSESQPRTPAGRALFERIVTGQFDRLSPGWRNGILAIEAEAEAMGEEVMAKMRPLREAEAADTASAQPGSLDVERLQLLESISDSAHIIRECQKAGMGQMVLASGLASLHTAVVKLDE